MKIVLYILLCWGVCTSVQAQKSYAEAMQQGDAAFKKGEYKKAINKYFAAEAFEPSKKKEVKARVNKVFDKIEMLRGEADTARRQAENKKREADFARTQAQQSRDSTKTALAKAQKLIDAFYFYEEKFALANKNRLFYFIDKEGNAVEKLGEWDEAEQFNEKGFARVKSKLSLDFLIDTLGNKYKVAYNIRDIKGDIDAIDLSFNNLEKIPAEVFDCKNLKILILSYNQLTSVSSKIGVLNQLVFLDLGGNKFSKPREIEEYLNSGYYMNGIAFNRITDLPAEIWHLKNLKTLILTGVPIHSSKIDTIKSLLPNCNIIYY